MTSTENADAKNIFCTVLQQGDIVVLDLNPLFV